MTTKRIFPYRAHPISPTVAYPQGTIAYRPIVQARVSSLHGASIDFDVLLDSGADACTFPLLLANALHLDLLRMPKGTTAGLGSQRNVTYYDRLIVDFGDDLRFEVNAGFTQGLDAVGLGLLGQRDFFDTSNIEFRLSERTFSVEKL